MSDTIDVFLFERYDFDNALLKESINEINELQPSFFMKLHCNTCLKLNPKEDIQSWDYLTTEIRRAKNDNQYSIGILSKPIENNWFSAVEYNENIGFITTDSWRYISELSVYAYILYEVFLNYQQMRLGKMLMHNETKACINDMCINKLDINFKIKSGWVCQNCLLSWNEVFSSGEIDDFNKILDLIRLIALNRKHVWQISNKFPSPIAIRFRLMQAESNSYLKFQKMIDLYDAIIRYVAFFILSTVPDNIQITGRLKNKIKSVTDGDPTLATWETIICEIINNPTAYHLALTQADIENIKQLQEIIETKNLRSKRNDYCGHNYAGQDLTEYYNLYIGNINVIKKAITFCERSIFRFVLAKIEAVAFEEGQPSITYRRFIGDTMIFNSNKMKFSETPFDNKHLILVDEAKQVYNTIFPYIVYATCKECEHERILYRDGAYPDNTPRYIDTLIGHRTKCI